MNRRNPFPGVGNQPETDRHGVRRWRLRRTVNGVKIAAQLPGAYGSAEFRAAYNAAHEGAKVQGVKAPAGTIGALIEGYLATPGFLKLKASTRRSKRLRLDRIRRNVGNAAWRDLERAHVEKIMDRLESNGGPHAANRFRKDLAQLYDEARRVHRWNGISPTEGVKSRKGRAGGHHTWSDAEIATYRTHHASGTLARLAMELLLNTGAARVDTIKLGRTNVRGNKIVYVRQKTEGQSETTMEVIATILPELAVELAQLPHNALLFLTHSGGKPYAVETFGNMFRDWCIAAGVPGRAHGLRKAAARRLAEHSAPVNEIMAVLGHRTPAEAIRYAEAANREGLSDSAFARLETKRAQTLPNLSSGFGNSIEKGDL